MGMDVGGESGGAMATPNVVPLIDILLVLIIIFMVITRLREGPGHARPSAFAEPATKRRA